MLVLHPTSRCDVCLLEYSWETSARVPHAIACGHIFCRDCLYATIPPLCPLCRKLYQPAKIKKLHVDRPENVDEAREVELGRQQLELLEKLVDIWDLELQEGFIANRDLIEDDNSRPGEAADREAPIESGSFAQRRVRISAGLALVNGGGNDGNETNDDGLPRIGDENALQLDRGDVEHILDGIAGTPGVGRGFLERWGPELGNNSPEGGPIVTMREARRLHYEDVMRQVDTWLESRDEETGVALRKSRRFLTEYLALRAALKQAITTTKSINENHSKLLVDLQGLDGIRQTLETERDEMKRYAEHMAVENQELKTRLQLRSSPPARNTRSQSSVLRNPLPAPPEPVSTEYLPTFAQAMSEESMSAPGSVYGGYSPANSNHGPALGVRFATPPPSSSRARERYNPGSEELGSPNGNSSKSRRKGKRRESSHSYSYRDDSGYFDRENYFREPSPVYPNSAPAVVDGYTSTPSRPRNAGMNSTFQNTQPVYNATYDPGQSNGAQQGYATRSNGLQVHLDAAQPVDVFTLTSAYLKEYSAGYLNGQEAAMGVAPFAQGMTPSYSALPGPSRSGGRKGDSKESIIYTTESAEDEARGRTREDSTHTRSRSGSGPGSLTSHISNPQLAAILSPSHPPQPTRRHMPTVSLPSTESHGHSSPSISLFSNSERSSHVSITGAYGREVSPTSTSSSGLPPPPLLPQDPVAAAAILATRHPGRVSPSVRSQQSWGTDAQSNSLIRGLRGLPSSQGDGYDNASVGTRERMSIDFAESVSRRDSRVSDLSTGSRSVRSGEGARDSSPVRPVDSMVGVLPLDDQDPDSLHRVDAAYPTSMNRSGSMTTNPNSYRSSTAVDRRMASESTVRGHGSSSTPFQIQSRSQHQVSQQTRLTDAQWTAASTGWTSTQDTSQETAPRYSPEHARGRTSSSRARNRDDQANHDERDGRQTRHPAHRSQTAMGGSSSVASEPVNSGSWLWDSDSNVYPSPFSHSSQAPTRIYEQVSPTSQPPVTQSVSSTHSNPPPSSYRSHRYRDRDPEPSGRSRHHNQEHSTSNTRPSLLSRDSSASFPISVESTDDERYPGANVNGGRSRTAVHASSGRSTRIGNSSSSINTANRASNNAETANPPLQSFGNALGLELNTTATGLSAPRPVSSSSTQSFLRTWSQGHS